MAAIEVRDLIKHYGDTRAVDGVSFDVADGQLFALLGPNGAGKSTTIEILEGHRAATSGHVRVLGIDPADATAERELRDRMGIVLQSSGIESQLTVREAVELYRSAYRNPRQADEVIEIVGLTEKADERVQTLSGGQQRRIDLALGLIGNPEVLFLDEPTTGFDPSARRSAWEMLEGLKSLGTTIMLTTHYMDEAEHLADRVAVIAKGRIVATGTPAELSARTNSTVIRFRLPNGCDAQTLPGLDESRHVSASLVEYRVTTATQLLHELTGWALDNHTELPDLVVHRPTLEDIYLELTDPTDEAAVIT